MLWHSWNYKVLIFTTLTLLGASSLPVFTIKGVIAQAASCNEVKIKKHIEKLENADNKAFDSLVKCKSKAVPALIEALKSKN
ncbi:hypothetical protein [Mastigocoleus testarum]|uniref:Uncharacterized protein n=1 Tax=Mastigocoleus testarum BC008 TaxID=371196 RepID=A0A0V7ZXU6_9CYAN|nr:hypothetical protein [Mastigocoleus testarum]KST69230.1 hypothetical protein BC008_03315 [Mastigocoleus testarum BC008]